MTASHWRVEGYPVDPDALSYIVHNMRERDRREVFALRWNDNEDQFTQEVFAVAGDLWRMWVLDGEPVAVNGVIPVRPGVVICGAFGTNKWRKVLNSMTRWSRKFVIPVLKTSGYHRAEAYVLAVNTDSRRWIELLGGEVETLLKAYGRQREDYLLYTWDLTRGEDAHVFLQRRKRLVRSRHDVRGAH